MDLDVSGEFAFQLNPPSIVFCNTPPSPNTHPTCGVRKTIPCMGRCGLSGCRNGCDQQTENDKRHCGRHGRKAVDDGTQPSTGGIPNITHYFFSLFRALLFARQRVCCCFLTHSARHTCFGFDRPLSHSSCVFTIRAFQSSTSSSAPCSAPQSKHMPPI